MDPNATLEWILRLRQQLDDAIEQAHAPDPDALYTLLGLLEELDGWLTQGRPLPARWRRPPVAPVLLPMGTGASNDVEAPESARRRRPLVRTRGRLAHTEQLPLPFRTGTR
jgi:hypothetical protein